MKIVKIKTGIFIFITAGFLLIGTWVSAGNLPVWGGTKTTTQPIQPTAPSQTNTPAQRSLQIQPRQTTVAPAAGARSTSSRPGTTSTPQPATPAKKARFRVTLTGFHVFAIEGVLPRGGLTYYAGAKVMVYSPWGAILRHSFNKSLVVGNNKKVPGAIRGGSATKNGGFRSGDVYPGSPPYAAPGAYPDRIPLVVWEGELVEGGNVVVIEPTLWEKRGSESIFRLWHEQFPNKLNYLIPCPPNGLDQSTTQFPIPAWTQQNQAPIHSLLASANEFRQSRACVNITSESTFRVVGRGSPDIPIDIHPHGMLLTYSKAYEMAAEKGTGPVSPVRYDRSFPKSLFRGNARGATTFPVGGVQPFWFGRTSGGDIVYINMKQAAYVASSLTFGAARPIQPDITAIELYLKVTKINP
ncbi:hypothetical protein [Geopsychrobacter electrodiphilus]|uniref:hypothetical protein n=1 Tax=Geopsychrobacter electrodiphilus TaxID=225196 RepID=UPI0012EC83BD|nr:hypothetical protein [Geopsychrobacter electrodiphilus]